MTFGDSRSLADKRVYAQDIAPADTREGVLWVDTSVSPPETRVRDTASNTWEPVSPPQSVGKIDSAETFAESDVTLDGWYELENESVQLPTGGFRDTFEDQDLTEWTTTGDVTIDDTSNEGTPAPEGSWMMRVYKNTDANDLADRSITAQSPRYLHGHVIPGYAFNNNVSLQLHSGGVNIIDCTVTTTQDVQVCGVSTGVTASLGQVITFELLIDWSSDTVERVRVNGTETNTGVAFQSAASSADNIRAIVYGASTNPTEGEFDDIRFDSFSEPFTVEWPRPTDIYAWDKATYQAAENLETVDVYVEESTDGATWTEVAGPIARGDDIPVSADNECRLRFDLSRTDLSNSPTVDAAYRRYTV